MNIFPIWFNYRLDYSVRQIIIESGKTGMYDWSTVKINIYNVKFLQLMQLSSWL